MRTFEGCVLEPRSKSDDAETAVYKLGDSVKMCMCIGAWIAGSHSPVLSSPRSRTRKGPALKHAHRIAFTCITVRIEGVGVPAAVAFHSRCRRVRVVRTAQRSASYRQRSVDSGTLAKTIPTSRFLVRAILQGCTGWTRSGPSRGTRVKSRST